MCQYSSKDGFMTDWHLVHLGSFARGGASLVFTEASAVQPVGRISNYDAGIWKEEHTVTMKRIVDFIHANHSLAGIQLAHSGRKGSTRAPFFIEKGNLTIKPEEGGWQPTGPTNEIWGEGYPLPHELTEHEIKEIVQAFKTSAQLSIKCGYDVIEIHGAHGYLIHSFNSPLTNKRKDKYGGDFEGRTRFCKEVVQAVREVWDDRPLFVRLSCIDWVEGGWNIEETVKLSKDLKKIGVDLIDCSSGGNSPLQKIKEEPGYQVPFSEQVKREVGILTGAVGRITESKQANEIIESGKSDIVLMARQFLRDPHFPLRAASELGVEVDAPHQYERAVSKF